MGLRDRLGRLEARGGEGRVCFSAWHREGEVMVEAATGERLPAAEWARRYPGAFTVDLRRPHHEEEGDDGAD